MGHAKDYLGQNNSCRALCLTISRVLEPMPWPQISVAGALLVEKLNADNTSQQRRHTEIDQKPKFKSRSNVQYSIQVNIASR